jgi:predicted Zn-dependent protease
MSRTKGLLWMALVCAAAAAAAAALPWLARHVPWGVERFLATALGAVPEGDACGGRSPSAARRRFDALLARVYPLDAADAAVPIRVTVLPGRTVNAFAALGGRIYVFDGLLQQALSPEELAGVLAHEIENVRNRHILQALVVNLVTAGAVGGGTDPSAASRMAYLLLTLRFSREQEAQADAGGLERLQRAQVDAAGVAAFFERARKAPQPPQFISSHPDSAPRARSAAAARGYPTRPVLDAADWATLRTICTASAATPAP